jgi:3'(2'), 5'-bisphosphate nucleotidase
VLEAAGGAVLTVDGGAMAYGKAGEKFLNPFFAAASSPELAEKLCAEMQRVLAI